MSISTKETAVNETELQSNQGQTTRTASPVFNMLPSALQTGLQLLALVRRSLSAYSYASWRRANCLFVFRSESEDTLIAANDMAVTSSCSAEVPGIYWKFARHGKVLHLKTFHHETS